MTDGGFAAPTPPGQATPRRDAPPGGYPPVGAGVPAEAGNPGGPGRPPKGGPTKGAPRWALWFGVIASVVILVGIVWAGVLVFLDSRTAPADPDATGDMHALSVVEGMCIASVSDDGPIATVEVVACERPHHAQVVAATNLPVEVYPGGEGVVDQAEEFCEPRIPLDLPAGAGWTMWVPTADSWQRGDRTVSCLVVANEELTESLIDAPVNQDEDTTQTQNA
ncbi:septum formation family protein [Demequina flava]|uniref:septum formation family protein n=1 Tax=Demequina flava TaxID=1095025 RepID=UPI000781ACBA|nr:septum formation family protein [Demequina flava]